MVSSGPHEPPKKPSVDGGTSATTIGVPPSRRTLRIAPRLEKPTHAPSGEKNGQSPPSVPAIGRAVTSSIRRAYSRGPPRPDAVNTMVRPSGEMAGGLYHHSPEPRRPESGSTTKRTGPRKGDLDVGAKTARPTATPSATPAASRPAPSAAATGGERWRPRKPR